MPKRSRSRSPLKASYRKYDDRKEDEYDYQEKSISKSKHKKRKSRSKERVKSYGRRDNSRDKKKHGSRSPESDKHRHSKRSRSRERHRNYSPKRNKSPEKRKHSRSRDKKKSPSSSPSNKRRKHSGSRDYKGSKSRRKSASCSPSNDRGKSSKSRDYTQSRSRRKSPSSSPSNDRRKCSKSRDYRRSRSRRKSVSSPSNYNRRDSRKEHRSRKEANSSKNAYVRLYSHENKERFISEPHKKSQAEIDASEKILANKQMSGLKSWQEFEEYMKEEEAAALLKTVIHKKGIQEEKTAQETLEEYRNKGDSISRKMAIKEVEHKSIQRENVNGGMSKIEEQAGIRHKKDRGNGQSTKTTKETRKERFSESDTDNNTVPRKNRSGQYPMKKDAMRAMEKADRDGSHSAESEDEDDAKQRSKANAINAMKEREELARTEYEPSRVDFSSQESDIDQDAIPEHRSKQRHSTKKDAINAMKNIERMAKMQNEPERGSSLSTESDASESSKRKKKDAISAMRMMEELAGSLTEQERGGSPYAGSDVDVAGTRRRPQFPSKEEAIEALKRMDESAKAQHKLAEEEGASEDSETEDLAIPGPSSRHKFSLNHIRMLKQSASTGTDRAHSAVASGSSTTEFRTINDAITTKAGRASSSSTDSDSEEDDKHQRQSSNKHILYAMALSKETYKLETGKGHTSSDDPIPSTSRAYDVPPQETEVETIDKMPNEDEKTSESEASETNMEKTAANIPQTQNPPEEEEKTYEFRCSGCDLQERCHYIGKRPEFVNNVQFLEDCYVMKDPFSPPPPKFIGTKAEYFIVLGSHCAICGDLVCKSPLCSMFYFKTFCLPCAAINTDQFPLEICTKIKMQIEQ